MVSQLRYFVTKNKCTTNWCNYEENISNTLLFIIIIIIIIIIMIIIIIIIIIIIGSPDRCGWKEVQFATW
jgi:hypothetical protein